MRLQYLKHEVQQQRKKHGLLYSAVCIKQTREPANVELSEFHVEYIFGTSLAIPLYFCHLVVGPQIVQSLHCYTIITLLSLCGW